MERDGQLVFVEFSWSSWKTTGRDPQTDFSGLSMSVKDWPRRKIRKKTDDADAHQRVPFWKYSSMITTVSLVLTNFCPPIESGAREESVFVNANPRANY